MNAHTGEDWSVRTVGWTMGAVLSGSFLLVHRALDLHWTLWLIGLTLTAFCTLRLVLVVCFPHVDFRPLLWLMGATFWLVCCFSSDVIDCCRRMGVGAKRCLRLGGTTCYLGSILAPLAILAPFAFLLMTEEERRERSYDDHNW